MHSHHHGRVEFVRMVSNWAVFVSSIGALASQPLLSRHHASVSLHLVGNQLTIHDIVILNGLINAPVVVIGNGLLGSTSYGVVMLNDSDGVHHAVARLHGLDLNVLLRLCLIEHLLRE